MTFQDILEFIYWVFGILIVGFGIGFPIAWIVLKLKEKIWKNKIPEEIKKEVQDAKIKRQTEMDEARTKYRQPRYGSNGEGEFGGLKEAVGYIKPADSNLPRDAEVTAGRSVQVQSSNNYPGNEQEPEGDRLDTEPDESNQDEDFSDYFS